MNDEWFLQDFQARALMGPRRLSIDVGANVGDWSRWMAGYFDCVVAIEPDPRAIESFRRRGVPSACSLLPVACGARNEIADYYLRDQHEQSSLCERHPIGGGDQRLVNVTDRRRTAVVTLDQIAELFSAFVVDFVKIDVEGTEADVLSGIQGPLFRRARFIVEIHDRAHEVGVELQRLGYDKLLRVQHPYKSAHRGHEWLFLPPLEQE